MIYPTAYVPYLRFTKLLSHIQFISCFHWSNSSIWPRENNCEEGTLNHCGQIVENETISICPCFIISTFPSPKCLREANSIRPRAAFVPLMCRLYKTLTTPPVTQIAPSRKTGSGHDLLNLFDLLGSVWHFFYIVICDISKLLDKWRIQSCKKGSLSPVASWRVWVWNGTACVVHYTMCSTHWVLCHRLELMNKGIRHGIII